MCIYLNLFPRVYNNSNLCVLCVTLQKWRLKNKHTYILRTSKINKGGVTDRKPILIWREGASNFFYRNLVG